MRHFKFLMVQNFNPRSSCEERLPESRQSCSRSNFNPRSSCEERRMAGTFLLWPHRFQSTLLMRGATIPPERLICHAHFNPRSSCEERRQGSLL